METVAFRRQEAADAGVEEQQTQHVETSGRGR
jgi:hypothetical protein